MLTNTELVETFIENSLRQKDVLLSNPTFSAETICGINQLTSHQHGILLKISLTQDPIEFYLRRETPQTPFLQRLLGQHQFLMAQKAPEKAQKKPSKTGAQKTTHRHFDTYRYFSVQHGYQFNCNTGRALWKNWRAIKRLSANASKLLVRNNEGKNWAEIQSIGVSNELILIETTDNKEVVHNFEDAVLWLNKVV